MSKINNYYAFVIGHWCGVNNIYTEEEYNFELLYNKIIEIFNDSNYDYLTVFLDEYLTKDILLNNYINVGK